MSSFVSHFSSLPLSNNCSVASNVLWVSFCFCSDETNKNKTLLMITQSAGGEEISEINKMYKSIGFTLFFFFENLGAQMTCVRYGCRSRWRRRSLSLSLSLSLSRSLAPTYCPSFLCFLCAWLGSRSFVHNIIYLFFVFLPEMPQYWFSVVFGMVGRTVIMYVCTVLIFHILYSHVLVLFIHSDFGSAIACHYHIHTPSLSLFRVYWFLSIFTLQHSI